MVPYEIIAQLPDPILGELAQRWVGPSAKVMSSGGWIELLKNGVTPRWVRTQLIDMGERDLTHMIPLSFEELNFLPEELRALLTNVQECEESNNPQLHIQVTDAFREVTRTFLLMFLMGSAIGDGNAGKVIQEAMNDILETTDAFPMLRCLLSLNRAFTDIALGLEIER